MLQYILQAVAFQLIFLLVFELFLKKETFFTYNRVYLLLTPLISILLPLLKIGFLQQAIPSEAIVFLPEILIGAGNQSMAEVSSVATSGATESGLQINWWLITYAAGFLLSLLLFLNKFRILKRLFRFKAVTETAELKIVQVPQSKIACTFYNTVFLGEDLTEAEREQILSHEIVHVRQRHTLDLLYFEFLKIVFWFNPLVYIFQSRISAVHEFLADQGVVKKVERQQYYQQLLNSAFSTQNITFINQFFNHSLIKKRIIMLQRSKSNTIAKFKFTILIPLILAMMTYVSCSDDPVVTEDERETTAHEKLEQIKAIVNDGTEVSAEDSEEIKEILKTISLEEMKAYKSNDRERVQVQELKDATSETGNVPFAVIEEVPIFPGCEDLESNDARKECMSDRVTDFVNKNFDTSLGKELGLEGVKRIYVQFKIAKDGSIEVLGARAPHPALQEEAERVVNMLPQMQPGKHKGQEVGVLYSLPITFQVGE